MSFNNPTEFLPNLRCLPPQSQMMPSPFLKDLEPKVMTSFNFFKNIQPYRINNKSEMVVVSNRMPKNNYGSSAFSPITLPSLKPKNFIFK